GPGGRGRAAARAGGGGGALGGRLHYGHFLTAGEIGHMHVLPTNPPGQRSLEHNCSRSAVVDRIVRLVRSNRKSMVVDLVGGDFDKIRSKTIAEAYAAGDALVREVVDDSADLLGAHVGGIVTLLALPRVVLGGGLTEAVGPPYVARVREAVRRVAFPDKCKAVEVMASELLDDAGIVGAALLAAERIGAESVAK
ncbi:MAG: ROK family protein, partial [Phycisphaeraceae bacterium]|nr:ROK family protein [Phycisphaeraceae bacterium]